jgi:hypothetical protein
MADQKRMEEVTIKNVEITKMEVMLQEEQRNKLEEIAKRDRRIKDLEKKD